MAGMKIFILFSWGSNNLTNYGRRHFKLLPTVIFRGTPCIFDALEVTLNCTNIF